MTVLEKIIAIGICFGLAVRYKPKCFTDWLIVLTAGLVFSGFIIAFVRLWRSYG